MGRRGPRPVPTERLKLVGSRHAYDRKNEPAAILGDPVMPDWLPDGAKLQWRIMVDRLRGMQVLSAGDREALSQFCCAWSEYERLESVCRTAEFTVETARGGVMANPIFGMRDKAWDRVLKMGREFGYTPAARADISKVRSPQKTDKTRFFGKGSA